MGKMRPALIDILLGVWICNENDRFLNTGQPI